MDKTKLVGAGILTAILIPFLFMFGIIILIMFFFDGGQTSPLYSLAYANEITMVLSSHADIRQPLFLALIAHESGGDWHSTNKNNTNGTIDAGLCQINSANWATYAISSDPYNVPGNLNVGATMFGKALRQNGRDVAQALYAYNAGTAQRGATYNPSYAPAVLAIYEQLQTTQVYASLVSTPVSGQPMSIIAAERSGVNQNFINPAQITVENERTHVTVTAQEQPGDGGMWAPQAVVYQITFPDVQEKDVLDVTFLDGKTTTIEVP